jgi:hypothetical protein
MISNTDVSVFLILAGLLVEVPVAVFALAKTGHQ